MRWFAPLLLCLVLLTSCLKSPVQHLFSEIEPDPIEVMVIEIDRNRLWSVMEDLSYPRPYGQEGEARAAAYLITKLEEFGYQVAMQEFPVYKSDLASLSVYDHHRFFDPNPYDSELRGMGRNIIAKQDNFDSFKKTIYLTAHYDTMPQTTGILDNATGVSAVLEVARQLKDFNGPFNLVVIFFSAEEYGMTGSRAYIAHLSDEEKQGIIGFLNVDMIGQKDAGDIVMKTTSGKPNVLTLMFNNLLDSPLSIDVGGSSDELSFYMGKLPAITLANQCPDRTRDDDDDQFRYIDLDQLADAADLITNFLVSLTPSQYISVLNQNRRVPKNIDSQNNPWATLIEGSPLVEIYVELVENGRDGATVYLYESADGKRCKIAVEAIQFVDPNVYSGWDQINGRPFTYIHIPEDPDSDVKAQFAIYSSFGRVLGEVSSEEAARVVELICSKIYRIPT